MFNRESEVEVKTSTKEKERNMAKISYSKEDLAGPPPIPEGMYEVRLSGFQPKRAKSGTSTNLQPQMEIVNNPSFNGSRIFDNLNSSASWIVESFCHAFGHALIPNPNGGGDMPGDFIGPDDDPEKWQYQGPLTGSVAKVYIKHADYNGRTNPRVDQWFCAVPGCTTKHATGLAK